MTESQGKRFGQRAPPITELIRNILGRYPDGGQILKELIQNADDAGASEVKFLYDDRSFGTTYLTSAELAKFQGPALYAYNDATFKDTDWEGIQNLMRSDKKKDPLKVGRFGIGFNSVYHITDLPGIVSGETIGFLDPHEKYFVHREPGRRYDFGPNLLKGELRDQFRPFNDVFGCDLHKGRSYQSTLFRFPLRQKASKLSKKKYTKDMVDSLFKSLRQEGAIILLFLNNVQKIGVYKRDGDDQQRLFKVEVAQSRREEIRQAREEMVARAALHEYVESKYVVDVQVTSDARTERFKWLVVNQIGPKEGKISELSEGLCLLPWVGCAVLLKGKTAEQNSGRIFCFLPLPDDVECKTGLPVLVHGYFGVMDNRRGLVWPGAECQNNQTAEWNELLLKEICCAVYRKVLEALVKNQPNTGLNEVQRCQLVYSTLPNLEKVKGHWRCILDPLFKDLLNVKLFYSLPAREGSWITLYSGVLDELKKNGVRAETRDTILETLLKNSHVVITDLPHHVSKIVEKYVSKPNRITPGFVRSCLRNPAVQTSGRENNLLLLEYILSDDPEPEDINGVSLLPLSCGNFVPFRSHCHTSNPSASIFVPSGECTEDLLPNMSSRFLDQTIPRETFKKLKALAATGVGQKNSTQLVKLTKNIVIENLPRSLPAEWFDSDARRDVVRWTPGRSRHPAEKWLDSIWSWINQLSRDSLEPFQGVPLIPLPSRKSTKILGVLSKNSKFIFKSDSSGNVLPLQVADLLKAAGCTILSSQPCYLPHRDINLYIAPATPVGVTSLLHKVPLHPAQQHVKLCSSEDRRILREFFTRFPRTLTSTEQFILRQLPLFYTLNGSCTAVQPENQTLPAASPEFKNLPIHFSFRKKDKIISSTDPNSSSTQPPYRLLQMLDVQILKTAEVFLRFLFPDIQARNVYDMKETSTIMLWILQRMSNFNFQCPEFLEAMKRLPFVTTNVGQLKKPSELYDPTDPILSVLFSDEARKFPSKDYSEIPVISALKKLGLRTKLTASELLQVSRSIASSSSSPSSIRKVHALIKILNDVPDYLEQSVDQRVTLGYELLQLKWLPRATTPPHSCRFPESMPWYNNDVPFFAPTELRSTSEALLIGSSMPILGDELENSLPKLLRSTVELPVKQVVSQLSTAVRIWSKQSQRKATSQFQEMLVAIYRHLSRIPRRSVFKVMEEEALKHWIWHGAGFCSPAQIALEDFPLDLRPHLFLLPDDFIEEESLSQFFLQHGVRRKFSEEDIVAVLPAIKYKHAESRTTTKTLERDLELCRSILEWLVKDGEPLSESLQEKIFVPVQSPKTKLVLAPCKQCTYCDRDWLRCGKSELDIHDDYRLIHDSLSPKTAKLLGVPALSSCLLSAETLGFEQIGPHEPITRRIKNILKEYKEGVGIFRELIQNADDAGATKVRFLVDWRLGPKKRLLSPGMAGCQGPALWAYNDGVFTDKDFENINKLAGATKVEDFAKIGRFGLGFNAVYHLTDVPSFISRKYFVVFDPNVNHLQSHIHDKSRPGIRINLSSNPMPLSVFADQFVLYDGVFGCKTRRVEGEKFSYDGTLFRFPFRTSDEAKKSQICRSVYDDVKVKKIARTLKKNASLVLLYTQHIDVVELYEVGRGDRPRDMELVLSIKKETETISGSASGDKLSFIEECSNWWQKRRPPLTTDSGPTRSEFVTIEAKESVSRLTGTETSSVKKEMWLLTSCVGKDASIRLADGEGQNHGLLPMAGAAAKIRSVSGGDSSNPAKFIARKVEGEAFCFLPLSIPTGLPVHVNGSFAVRSNRDGIWEKTTSEQSLEARWNECLLKDALSEAFIQLLNVMKDLSERGHFRDFDDCFHEFWPRFDALRGSIWESLVTSFYSKLVNDSLPLLCSDRNWVSITSGYILHKDLRDDFRVMKALQSLGQNVFQLPSAVIKSLERSGLDKVLQSRTLTLESFFKDFLFPNLSKIPARLRNPIITDGLDRIEGIEKLKSLYEEYPCIACSADGLTLAKPCQLINPRGSVAILFSAEEQRFPVGDFSDRRLFVLEKLGMVKDLLSWDEICGRTKSIAKLAVVNYKRGLERSAKLVKYLRENIERIQGNEEVQEEHLDVLQSTKFLPALHKPAKRYTLPWKGLEYRAKQFFSPNDLFLPSDVDLVGSCCLVVDETVPSGCGDLGVRVEELLGFNRRRPSNTQVLQQLKIAMKHGTKESKLIQSVCQRVYEHLDAVVREKPNTEGAKVIGKLNAMSWLFIEGRFVPTQKVAFGWKGNGAPYLYGVPSEYSRKYESLLRASGVKQVFQASDYISALDLLCESRQHSRLKKEEIKLTVSFLNELKDTRNEAVKARIGTIPLPDAQGVLYKSGELTIEEDFWLKDRGDARYVHEDITPRLALSLGAKRLCTRRQSKYANTFAVSFGQHEKLTDRLKNILKSYPCDGGILKELVQNADDAEATEIHFVYDTRTLRHRRVFQNHAKEIQGPALCVYNDQHFSEEDLKGIQKLGIGSKGDDPEKTGQYGIGFNAVYHLTDCPSFLSNDETLCILDPRCRYARQATVEAPGVRFSPVDKAFKEDFHDSITGYLGEYFDLKGSTMFRLPLRTPQQAKASQISDMAISDRYIRSLLNIFITEAKNMLLFLNHVKKISLSEIGESRELRTVYSVECSVDRRNEKKSQEIALHVRENKAKPTHQVPWKGVTYPIRLQDSKGLDEEWLIHQCCGVKPQTGDNDIPDGRDLGLLPRGGVAALVSPFCSFVQYFAYCFLPLPITTSLPVHVNGHFVLGSSRRDLWNDTSNSCRKTKWNTFMKSNVLATGYAALIDEARNYIPNSKRGSGGQSYFSSAHDAEQGLHWYHGIFPDPRKDPDWEILAVEVYRCLLREETPFLPVVVRDEYEESAVANEYEELQSETRSTQSTRTMAERVQIKASGRRSLQMEARLTHGCPTSHRRPGKTREPVKCSERRRVESPRQLHFDRAKTGRSSEISRRRRARSSADHVQIRKWLPAGQAYFTLENKRKEYQSLFAVLLRVYMPLLLYSPSAIYDILSEYELPSRLIDARSVINFLLTSQEEKSECKIGELPVDLKDTTIRTKDDLKELLLYCKNEETFLSLLEGVPLLLTADGQLRVFNSKSPVYCSSFSDLFPKKAHRFVHSEIVDELRVTSTTKTDHEFVPGVMLSLTVSSLADELMPEVFRERLMLGGSEHLPWNYPEDGVLSETWFRRLWEFLGSCSDLNVLSEYPIVPTTDGQLATVKHAKSVLDANDDKVENSVQKKVLEILKGMACPCLKMDITASASSVLGPYVAHPHSVLDVLHVLDYMRQIATLESANLDDENIVKLLCFFQEDCENSCSIDILKRLPFYKALDGHYHPLSSYSSCVEVPAGLPEGTFSSIMRMGELQFNYKSRCLFLQPGHSSSVYQLYKALDVETQCTVPEFYMEYILPIFTNFSGEDQMEFLTHIRDNLALQLYPKLSLTLRSTRCIPDQNGRRQCASWFFDSNNQVFKVMLATDTNKFPSFPFNKPEWTSFLIEIGLKTVCDENKFLEFCRQVERAATQITQSEGDEAIDKQSRALVEYLFTNEHLHKDSFLSSVARIKFISPERVEKQLSSVHRQHQDNGTLQHVQFCNSVQWKDRKLVWTSAQLLPKWAKPSNSRLAGSLGIREKPALPAVISHLIAISNCVLKLLEVRDALPPKVQEIFVAIYDFFMKRMQEERCENKNLSGSCNNSVCQMIDHHLKSVACILLHDENRLIRGEQLAFNVLKEELLKPHFYRVPRTYGAYEHFLRRLGTTEEMTPLQMVNVLKSIKECCKDGQMSSENEKKAHHATFVFFDSLDKEVDGGDSASKLSETTELYLPSQRKELVKSNELVCQIPPRLAQPVSNLGYKILCPFEECGLRRARENEYIKALPQRLRPRALETLVREELNPSCRHETCLYGQRKHCTFIERYILILRSSQFQHGILRLMKYQKKLEKLEDEDKEKAARLGSNKVTIKCMRTIKIHLVDTKTQIPLKGSSFERTCQVVREGESWTLYIQHEFGGKKNQAVLSKAVNEIMDGCVEDAGIGELTDMLSCDMPCQIPDVLSDHNVLRDFLGEDEELGLSVSSVYHYLMVQNPLCNFEEGTRVAYGQDQLKGVDWMDDDEVKSSTKYILAKIIRRASETKPVAAEYDFNAEYLIDLGTKTEVSRVNVLDIYSYRQDEIGNLITDEEDATGSRVNVDVEKCNIHRALLLAWKLSPQMRRKVLRRLFLHWHRCKNSEVARELTDFLISEVAEWESEQEKAGTLRLIRRWKMRGRRERDTYSHFVHSMSSSGSSYSTRRFQNTSDYAEPDRKEAARWIKQSQADLEDARSMRSNSHSMVCYLCEQVVEKSLKAALYAKCGIPKNDLRTHDVGRLTSSVHRLDGAPDVSPALKVANYYLDTRYPDRHPCYKVPAEEFNGEQAEEALNVAEKIFECMKNYVYGEDE